MGRIIQKLYPTTTVDSTPRRILLQTFEAQLDQWYLNLPDCLLYDVATKRNIPPPHVLFVHIRYWGAVLLLNSGSPNTLVFQTCTGLIHPQPRPWRSSGWANSWPGVGSLLDDSAALDPDTTDLNEFTSVSHIISDELSNDGNLGVGVDGLSWSVEAGGTLTVRVEIATVLVDDSVVSVATVTAVGGVVATEETGVTGWMWGVGVGDGVGFPDVHLVAARAVLAGTGVGRGAGPAIGVGLKRGR